MPRSIMTAQEPKFEENQWVWLFNPVRKKGRSPKLQIGWEEKPYKILKQINEVQVQIQRQGGTKRRIIHVNRIRRVRDPDRVIPAEDIPLGQAEQGHTRRMVSAMAQTSRTISVHERQTEREGREMYVTRRAYERKEMYERSIKRSERSRRTS